MSDRKEVVALANISLAMKMNDVPAKNKVEYALSTLQQTEPLTLPASIKLKALMVGTIQSQAYDETVAKCNKSFEMITKNEQGVGRELMANPRNHFLFTQITSQHNAGHNHDASQACEIQLNPTEIIKQAAKVKPEVAK